MDMVFLYQLVSHSTIRLGDALVLSTCFIVQYMEVCQHIEIFKTLHDGALVKESVFVGA